MAQGPLQGKKQMKGKKDVKILAMSQSFNEAVFPD